MFSREKEQAAAATTTETGRDPCCGTGRLAHRTASAAQIFFSDGPFGINTSAHRAGNTLTTAFPCGANLAASFDPALVARVAAAIAAEAHAVGANLVLGPAVDIVRHPNAGQAWAGFGEDPFLAGRIAVAYVRGIHSARFGRESGAAVVGSCLKHFVCYNQETERHRYNAVVSERALREIYLAPFEAAVREAAPDAVMSSYNSVNGLPMSENTHLLRDILRGEWGFSGVVCSDWGGCSDLGAALHAGLSIKMPGPAREREVENLRKVPQRIIEQAAKTVEECAAKLVPCSHAMPKANVRLPEHRSVAEDAALGSFVLLKNEHSTLPIELDAQRHQTLLLCGQNARHFRFCGPGSSGVDCSEVSAPIFALQSRIPATTELIDAVTDPSLLEKGVPSCDVAVVFAGAPSSKDDVSWRPSTLRYEGESCDRTSLSLPSGQDELLARVSAVARRTVVILNVGAPVSMPWLESVDSVLWVGYPGMRAASALVSVLVGDVSPSGKLPITFPRQIEDCPGFSSFPFDRRGRSTEHTVTYNEGVFVGYRHYDHCGIAPLFCFGHGLSYTRFEYSNICTNAVVVSSSMLAAGAKVSVSFQVENSGDRLGSEVAQLYVTPPATTHQERPPLALRAFAKVTLGVGEKKPIEFELGFRDFAMWKALGDDKERWAIDPGIHVLSAAASSRDVRLHIEITLI